MSSQLIFYCFDIVAVFATLLFGAHVLTIAPKQLNARLLALICLNTVCAILLSRQELGYWIPDAYRINVGMMYLPFHIARNLTPGVLMVLSFSAFQDEEKFPRWLLAAFALQITLEVLAWWLVPSGSASQYSWLKFVPAALELMFVAFALYWVLSNWQADLVEARRRLRGVFLAIVGANIFLEVLLDRLVIPWDSDGTLYTHIALSILCIVLSSVALLMTGRWGKPFYVDQFPDEKTPAQNAEAQNVAAHNIEEGQTVTAENHDAAMATIVKAFREQRIYRDGELTIASLAAKLSMPEYKLRKLIHEQLGYRNFNALLHEYRVAEACEDLSNPAKNHLPILTIALTVGYNSINPFNRAFREAKDMTPSTFRAQDHSSTQKKTAPILEN